MTFVEGINVFNVLKNRKLFYPISSLQKYFYHKMSSDKKKPDNLNENRKQDKLNPGTKNENKESVTGSCTSSSQPITVDSLRRYLAEKLNLLSTDANADKIVNPTKNINIDSVLETLDFDGLIKYWNENGFKNIITMVGAGISTSAGIPDFRSPDTGLYNNLQKYNLPHPTAIFQLDYFLKNPKPFFSLAKELYPGTFKPTPCHYFIKFLNDKGMLLRHYTQNIDTLERIAGIEEGKLVEAHGTFHTNHCVKCKKAFDMEWIKVKIFADEIPKCKCGGIVKPDIVFFGENLPEKFYELPFEDFKKCDLLIILGTSLEVQPFASLVGRVNKKCVRFLINREKVGTATSSWGDEDDCLFYDHEKNTRDVAWFGDCDEGVQKVADTLGFGDELKEFIKIEHNKIDKMNESAK